MWKILLLCHREHALYCKKLRITVFTSRLVVEVLKTGLYRCTDVRLESLQTFLLINIDEKTMTKSSARFVGVFEISQKTGLQSRVYAIKTELSFALLNDGHYYSVVADGRAGEHSRQSSFSCIAVDTCAGKKMIPL